MGRTKRSRDASLNPQDIIFGAKAIISGLFRQHLREPEIDDSYFIPMLKTCINKVVENCRKAGVAKSEAKTIHDALYQHALDEYVNLWLHDAREDMRGCDEAEEIEDATEKFVALYEGDDD